MPNIGKRNILIFLNRLFQIDNYLALINFFKVHKKPFTSIFNEIFSTGLYPTKIFFKTPIGVKSVKIYSPNDFSTFNLIFCRKDYAISKKNNIILDIGSNIGLSAVYWLTRNKNNVVYCYEPSSINFTRLKENLKQFKSRIFLHKKAVSNKQSTSKLHIEKSGVYNSLTLRIKKEEKSEICKVSDINSCISKIVSKHKKIDMIKVDNEGEEIRTVSKIDKKYWRYINYLNVDGKLVLNYVPKNYSYSRKGSAQRYIKINKYER
mgnify:FL=1|tara:strand:- start:15 stop:803 length:789 start_codon:yes stop_codon:yes gene_type:complete